VTGSCRLTCQSGYTAAADNKSCVATSTDVNNCGTLGNQCTTSGTGVQSGSCVTGSCRLTCQSGYTASPDNKSCVATSTDVNNCGSLGNQCTTSGTGVTSGSCVAGGCRIVCAAGYTASADNLSCSAQCKDGTYFNAGKCVRCECVGYAKSWISADPPLFHRRLRNKLRLCREDWCRQRYLPVQHLLHRFQQ
jgi:hypothetical protein